jgi:hypothetical protein
MLSSDGYDLQYFLVCSLGALTFLEVESRTDASTGVTSQNPISPGFSLSPAPIDLRNAFYCHERISGRSYLSYWSGSDGRYRSYTWTSGSTPLVTELTGVDGRIEAALTTGQILVFDEGICTVYDGVGKKQFDFPLGALRFCYERDDGGTFKLYFSLAYWLFGRDEKSDQLYVDVFSIQTTSLANLK